MDNDSAQDILLSVSVLRLHGSSWKCPYKVFASYSRQAHTKSVLFLALLMP